VDILQFLSFLVTWQGFDSLGPPYDPRKIYLIGHSCGAHILASIFLDSSSVSPTLTPPAPLFDAVQAIVMSEGIYDLDLLLDSFPDYREWFIEDAFGARTSYAEHSVTAFPLRTPDPRTRWLIIHSQGDSLVDMAQSEAMYLHLTRLHTISSVGNSILVSKNTNQLKEEHNAILSAEEFVSIVADYLLADQQAYQ
jgi:hypothetical protein